MTGVKARFRRFRACALSLVVLSAALPAASAALLPPGKPR
jgi:hypothetical protein